jgi:hypothetical protein
MISMRLSLIVPLLLTAALAGCAVKAQVRSEVEVPLLDPPPPPPRVVVTYAEEPEPMPEPPPVETAAPAKPAPRPPRAEQRPDPVETPPVEPVAAATKAVSPGALTLTPLPGSEAQTVNAIRALMDRASRDLLRVNAGALNHDGRAQLDQARRFLRQADEALNARNIVFAGRLADKAATMAAILVR